MIMKLKAEARAQGGCTASEEKKMYLPRGPKDLSEKCIEYKICVFIFCIGIVRDTFFFPNEHLAAYEQRNV
jgi:hypothetical protein